MVPQLEELGRRQEDGVEGVDHGGSEAEVLFPQEDVCHGMEDVLCIQEQAELPVRHQETQCPVLKASVQRENTLQPPRYLS